MTIFDFPALGAAAARYQTRENLVAAVRAADAHLQAQIDTMSATVRWVGAWDASSNAFPTTSVGGGAVAAGDVWVVSADGTVDGVSFVAGNKLLALGAGGATYAGNWAKLGSAVTPQSGGGTGAASLGDALVTPTDGVEDSLSDHLRDALTPTATGGTTAREIADHLADIATPIDFGATGNGVASDGAALAAAFTRGFVIGRPRYRHAFTSGLTLTTGAKVSGVLRVDLTASIPGNAPAITVAGDDVWVETLRLVMASGVSVGRAIRVDGARFRFDRLVVEYTDQQAVNDQTDAAVIFAGANPEGAAVETIRHDVGITMLPTASGYALGDLMARSFRQGVHLRAGGGFIECIRSETTSPNASASPGENTLTAVDVEDVSIREIVSRDASEHGIYFGGGGDVGDSFSATGAHTADVSIDRAVVRRAGQCAMKMKANAHYHENIRVGELDFLDAAFGSTAGSNEDGLRVENVRGLSVGRIVGRGSFNRANSTPGRSCFVGVYLDAVQRCGIDAVDIDTPASHLVSLLDTLGACGDIRVGYLGGQFIGGDAVNINSPTENFGRIFMENGAVSLANDGTNSGNGLTVTANSAAAGVTSPCRFEYSVTGVLGTGALESVGTTDPQLTAALRNLT